LGSQSQGRQQGDEIERERRLLTVAEGLLRQKVRRPVAAQVRDDHSIALRSQQRRHVDVAVNVVRPAVQEDDSGTIRRADVGIADVEVTGDDLLDVHAISRLAEGEHIGLGAGVDKSDLKGSVGDPTDLADQLVEPLLGDGPIAPLVDVEPAGAVGRLAID